MAGQRIFLNEPVVAVPGIQSAEPAAAPVSGRRCPQTLSALTMCRGAVGPMLTTGPNTIRRPLRSVPTVTA